MISTFSQDGVKEKPTRAFSFRQAPPERTSKWLKVTRETPCPICGNTKKECSISEDGHIAACWHVSQGSFKEVKGCYFHKLTDTTPSPLHSRMCAQALPCQNFDNLINAAECRLNDELMAHHAFALYVSANALRALHCGLYASRAAEGVLGFPMRDSAGKYIGVRLRASDGVKFCITGSRNGLFCAHPAPYESEHCFVVEGGTNLAALLSVGLWGVGRPSNNGGHELLIDYLRPVNRHIIIIRDNDKKEPAKTNTLHGAYLLAQSLLDMRKEIKVITTPTKDVRNFIANGANATQIFMLANNASTATLDQCRKALDPDRPTCQGLTPPKLCAVVPCQGWRRHTEPLRCAPGG